MEIMSHSVFALYASEDPIARALLPRRRARTNPALRCSIASSLPPDTLHIADVIDKVDLLMDRFLARAALQVIHNLLGFRRLHEERALLELVGNLGADCPIALGRQIFILSKKLLDMNLGQPPANRASGFSDSAELIKGVVVDAHGLPRFHR